MKREKLDYLDGVNEALEVLDSRITVTTELQLRKFSPAQHYHGLELKICPVLDNLRKQRCSFVCSQN